MTAKLSGLGARTNMLNYSYTARDNSGKVVKGVMGAEDEIELSARLSKLGLYLSNASISSKTIETTKVSRKYGRLSKKEVLNFTIQLGTLIESGVPLLSALRELSQDTRDKIARKIFNDLASHVEAGTSLREALSLHPHTFPKLYVSIVGAGEATGKLSFVLVDLANLLEWQLDLSAKIKEASVYPIILFVAMIGVVVLLVVKVIPMFRPMFKDLNVALPLPTQVILGLSDAFTSYWWVFLLFIVALVTGYKIAQGNERGAYKIDQFKLKLPIVGELLQKVALSNFCRTFSLSLKSGITVLSALSIASEVVGNKYLEVAIEKARSSVNVGEKIAASLENAADFPPLVIRMINVGEQTGSLSDTLEKVNRFYDKEIPSTLKRIFAIFEPMMIVVMGMVVGGIALSVFLPLLSIISKIGD